MCYLEYLGSLEDCYDELGSRYQLPVYVLSAPANLQLDSSDVDEVPEKLSPSSKKRKRGSELPIRLQLSTGPVLRLTLRTNDSVLVVRQHVAAMSDVNVSGVRLFFAGKQLTNNTRLKDAGLRKNYTIQAVLSDAVLSKTLLPTGTPAVGIAELPPSAEEPPIEVRGSLLTSTEALTVSAEQIALSVSGVPTTGSVDSVQIQTCIGSGLSAEQAGTSPVAVPSAESKVSVPVD